MPGEGSTITIKIPLTLAIMDGTIVKVGKSTYTVPIVSIKESFKARKSDIITDLDGNELIMIRGKCYPVLRLHEIYKVETSVTAISNGIMIMTENDGEGLCIFVDKLIGEQQVVVKALKRSLKKVECFKGEKINGHRPSVDVLFESVAKEAGSAAVGVILTGMGYDGAKGLLSMRKNGARTVGQDKKSSVVYGMPKVAYNIGAVEKQASLDNIPDIIFSMLG